MKANEFIKKFGLLHTVYLLKDTELTEFAIHSSCAGEYYMDTVCVSDLKRLVKSHELVDKHIKEHNRNFIECQIDVNGLKSFVKRNPKIYPKRLKQAIADVESCMGGV